MDGRGIWSERDIDDRLCPCCGVPKDESASEKWKRKAKEHMKHRELSEYVDAIVNALIEGEWCKLSAITREPLLRLLRTQKLLSILNVLLLGGVVETRQSGPVIEYKLNSEYREFLIKISRIEASDMGGRGA